MRKAIGSPVLVLALLGTSDAHAAAKRCGTLLDQRRRPARSGRSRQRHVRDRQESDPSVSLPPRPRKARLYCSRDADGLAQITRTAANWIRGGVAHRPQQTDPRTAPRTQPRTEAQTRSCQRSPSRRQLLVVFSRPFRLGSRRPDAAGARLHLRTLDPARLRLPPSAHGQSPSPP